MSVFGFLNSIGIPEGNNPRGKSFPLRSLCLWFCVSGIATGKLGLDRNYKDYVHLIPKIVQNHNFRIISYIENIRDA